MAGREDLAEEGAALSDDVRMGDADGEDELSDGASAVTDEEASLLGDTGLFEDPLFFSETPPLGEGADLPPGDALPGGAAGSSGDAPAVPPPLPAPATPPAEGLAAEKKKKQAPMAVVFLPGGKLTYYYSEKNAFCTAECSNPKHGRCIKTRTMKEPATAAAKSKGQGRPVGHLAAWLAKGVDLDSKALHWADEHQPSFAERVAARARVAGEGTADSCFLLAGEAPPHDGEEEPLLFA